jgi:hypothetical protein
MTRVQDTEKANLRQLYENPHAVEIEEPELAVPDEEVQGKERMIHQLPIEMEAAITNGSEEDIAEVFDLHPLSTRRVTVRIRNYSAAKRHKRHKQGMGWNMDLMEPVKLDLNRSRACSRCAFCAFLRLCLR